MCYYHGGLRGPPNWESLRKNFESGGGRIGGTFEQYQKRIFIDFQADPRELRRQSLASEDARFQVIRAHWYSAQMGEGPNAMLRQYFRRKAGIIDAPRPKGGWSSSQAKEIANNWRKRGAALHFDDQGEVVAVYTTLDLPRTLVDNDLADLRQFTHLRDLNLVGSRISDAGLAYLKDIRTLEDLNLGGTGITDAGLEHLRGHPSIVRLDVFDTGVTDAGLRYLRDLPNLRSLRIDETKIGQQAIRELQSQHPHLDVHSQGLLKPPYDN